MSHHKSVAIAAIVCISIIVGAKRLKQHQVGAAKTTDEKSKLARSVALTAAAEADDTQRGQPAASEARRRRTSGRRWTPKKDVRTPEQQDRQRKRREKSTAQTKEKEREKRRDQRRQTLMRMSLAELKERCRRADLPDVGRKAVLAEALQARDIRTQGRPRVLDDAEEFSLDDVRLAEQVASSNMKEHQVAEWLEQLEEIEDDLAFGA